MTDSQRAAEWSYGSRGKCDQCEPACICGINAHETGCPNAWRDPRTGEPNQRKCLECGCDFQPDERYQGVCTGCVDVYDSHLGD